VAAAAADEFVRWLNENNVTGGVYRLPTRKDTEDPQFSTNRGIHGFSVWLAPEGDHQEPSLWPTPGAIHLYAVSAQCLRESAQEDAEQAARSLIAVFAFGIAHALAAADVLARISGAPTRRQSAPRQIHAQSERLRQLSLDLLTGNTDNGQSQSFASRLDHAGRPEFRGRNGPRGGEQHRMARRQGARERP
jgi:hypothetical protein